MSRRSIRIGVSLTAGGRADCFEGMVAGGWAQPDGERKRGAAIAAGAVVQGRSRARGLVGFNGGL